MHHQTSTVSQDVSSLVVSVEDIAGITWNGSSIMMYPGSAVIWGTEEEI